METQELIVDAFGALRVRNPQGYDAVVTTNFYGDILSDIASELSGSLGLLGSINANAETGLCCAQAQRGSVPDIAGQNVANPTSLILSAAMMLSWLGEQRDVPKLTQAGKAIAHTVDAVIDDPAKRTRDLGGDVNTDVFGQFVAGALMRKAAAA